MIIIRRNNFDKLTDINIDDNTERQNAKIREKDSISLEPKKEDKKCCCQCISSCKNCFEEYFTCNCCSKLCYDILDCLSVCCDYLSNCISKIISNIRV